MGENMERKKDYKRTGSLVRPNDGLWAAFLVPIVVMIIIFIQRGIFPFGQESLLRTDMYHQYAPFFSEFQYKLRNGGSLLYSWDIGMGVNFAALYAYYLASPVNWLIILCPKAFVIEFMTYMIVLKIGLSGLAFAWYLKKKCGTDSIGVGYFGIFYALSGYMAAYSWNIMWLDCILLFPIVMLGLERLVKEGKSFLYCITLGLCILSNYYISIMICIFMVIYFVALLILENVTETKALMSACVRFAIFSLLAGAFAAIVLLPEIGVLTTTASGSTSFPKTLSSYFSIFDMIARHIACVETEIGLDHWPNIYCGVAVLMFFLLYLACKKVSLREKSVYCGMLLIFFASFSVNALNFIWHGFHYPNSLPARQSFIYIFLMLYMCFQAFRYLDETPKKHIAIAFWGSICFVLLAEKLVEQDHFHFSVYYVAILFLAMYAGLMYMYKNGKRQLAVILAFGLVAIEAAVNTTVTSVTYTSRESYTKDNEDVWNLMEWIQPAEEFYRVEKKTRKTKNDGAWMNFPSVSLFSSTANADLTQFFKRMGCEASTNAYSITGSTPLIDSLVSIKYALYSEEIPNTDLVAYMRESGSTYLYENLYTLPLGMVLPSDIDRDWQYIKSNPADVQNDLCSSVGSSQVLVWTTSSDSGKTYKFKPDTPGEYYAFVSNKKVKSVKAKLPSGSKTFNNVDRGYLLELGWLLDGNEVTLTSETDDQDLKVEIYRFDQPAMIETYQKMNQYPLKLTSWTDTKLEGVVSCDERGVLFTSIPYEEGWAVFVDGEEVETTKIFEAFLSVPMSAGDHEIRFEYIPKGFKLGVMISGSAVLIMLILFAAKRRLEKKMPKEEMEETLEMLPEMKEEILAEQEYEPDAEDHEADENDHDQLEQQEPEILAEENKETE